MIFLTDGRGTWIGPYLKEDGFAINRGKTQLTQNHGATDVYAVTADNEDAARRAFAQSKKD